MVTIAEIYMYLCSIAPLELQMDFDNSGFQLGRMSKQTGKVLLALDVTDEVVDEALELGAGLIVSHHPLLFTAVKEISDCNAEGKRLLRLIENGVAVISMHTNLDIAQEGVNDVLIRILGAEPEDVLDSLGCGRVGSMKDDVEFDEFLVRCRKSLNANGLRYYSAGKRVSRLAVMGGAGADSIRDAYNKGCDTYVTADIKYHQFQTAAELGINIIDADHFCTENPIMYALAEKLSAQFSDIEFIVSTKHKQIVSFA